MTAKIIPFPYQPSLFTERIWKYAQNYDAGIDTDASYLRHLIRDSCVPFAEIAANMGLKEVVVRAYVRRTTLTGIYLPHRKNARRFLVTYLAKCWKSNRRTNHARTAPGTRGGRSD